MLFKMGEKVQLVPELCGDQIIMTGIVEQLNTCDCGDQLVGVIWSNVPNFSAIISWYHAKYLLHYMEE